MTVQQSMTPFRKGQVVRTQDFGIGVIVEIEDQEVRVEFFLGRADGLILNYNVNELSNPSEVEVTL